MAEEKQTVKAPPRDAGGPQKTTMQQKVENETMLKFSSGSSGDDDLLSSLKTDITSKKRQSNESLIRDLKDAHFQSSEIEKDITELHDLLVRPKKRS